MQFGPKFTKKNASGPKCSVVTVHMQRGRLREAHICLGMFGLQDYAFEVCLVLAVAVPVQIDIRRPRPEGKAFPAIVTSSKGRLEFSNCRESRSFKSIVQSSNRHDCANTLLKLIQTATAKICEALVFLNRFRQPKLPLSPLHQPPQRECFPCLHDTLCSLVTPVQANRCSVQACRLHEPHAAQRHQRYES